MLWDYLLHHSLLVSVFPLGLPGQARHWFKVAAARHETIRAESVALRLPQNTTNSSARSVKSIDIWHHGIGDGSFQSGLWSNFSLYQGEVLNSKMR